MAARNSPNLATRMHAYFSSQLKSPMCFEGIVSGEIVHEEMKTRNKTGFGFDPIFKPENSDKTFPQMNVGEKCERSHCETAFRKFAEWDK